MISFKVLKNEGDVKAFIKENSSAIGTQKSEIAEMLKSNIENADGAEIAATLAAGCLTLRIYDGEYLFTCPVALSDDAEVFAAADEIRKYAIKEEIPLTFIDVYEDDVSEVCEPFRFVGVHPMDDSGEVFIVVPETEAGQLEELPTVKGEKITLDAISEEDISDYAFLCRDNEVNRLYGNDYKEDFGDASDEAFFQRMSFEVESGISMTFTVRYDGAFAGEASIFAFDFIGGAKVAIRLLPEFWGKGIGSEALDLILGVARDIDLKRISTSVKKENVSSIAMTKKYMSYIGDENDTALFEAKFN